MMTVLYLCFIQFTLLFSLGFWKDTQHQLYDIDHVLEAKCDQTEYILNSILNKNYHFIKKMYVFLCLSYCIHG